MTRSDADYGDGASSLPPSDFSDRTTAELVGERIRNAREGRGWSQSELARRAERTQTAVSYWEAGRRSIAVDELVKLAEVLDVPASSLLPEAHGVSVPSEQDRAMRAVVGALNRLADVIGKQYLP